MNDSASPPGVEEQFREVRQLRRLETLIDCVFALVIVLIVFDFPMPEDPADTGALEFVVDSIETLTIAAISVLIILVYWFQNNVLLGDLRRTDAIHGTLSILQILFVLFYLVAVGLGNRWGPEPIILAAQSATAALVGAVAAIAWWYASSKAGLIRENVDAEYVASLRLRVFAEPVTAVFTLALAFVGPLAWELGWLAYPLIAALLKRAGIGRVPAKP